MSDWKNHLSTLFPEVRLKSYLEMRGADGGPWRACALPAFWVGLLYDEVSLDAAWDIVKAWRNEERQALRDDVPRQGFAATIRGRTMLELAQGMPRARAMPDCSGASGSTMRAATRRAILRPLRRVRRARHHAGRGAAGEIPRPVGSARSSRCSPSTRIRVHGRR